MLLTSLIIFWNLLRSMAAVLCAGLVLLTAALLYRPLARVWFSATYPLLYWHAIEPYIRSTKRKHFDQLYELAASKRHDQDLGPETSDKGGALRLLEIGVGQGANLKYYPAGTHFIGVDLNPHFRFNPDHTSHLASVTHILGFAEDMHRVPSGSCDVVVSSYTHCSVRSREETLREVSRVLRSGGRYFYFEHVTFNRKTHPVWRVAQVLFEPFWSVYFAGCRFRGPTDELISMMSGELGWRIERADRDYGDNVVKGGFWKWAGGWAAAPLCWGVAVKVDTTISSDVTGGGGSDSLVTN